ncbi:FecR family protein [Sphingobacterium anhuiense]
MHFAWYDLLVIATIGCMQDRKRELEELINKYSEGRLTDLERGHLMKWMRELDLSNEEQIDMNQSYHKMKEQIDSRLLLREVDAKKVGHSWQLLGQVAAVLLCCLSLGWYLVDRDRIHEPQKVEYSTIMPSLIKAIKKVCTVSKDSLVVLEDGTRVHLLANSTMTWTQPFPDDCRAIQLQGKAFFEVAHDHERPFTVLASNILTTALGTSFWVVQDNKSAKPKIRLVTGRVSIKEKTADGAVRLLAFLTPGQSWKETVAPARQRDRHPEVEERIVEAAVIDTLTFHHKPLEEVLPALASLYHTTIRFSSKEVSGLSFYGTYTKDDDIAQILQTICFANDLEMTFNAATNTYAITKVSQ